MEADSLGEAADQGYALGQEYLGYAYEDGAGVPKDYVWRTSDGSLWARADSRRNVRAAEGLRQTR